MFSIPAKLTITINFWRRSGNAYYKQHLGLSLTEVHVLSLLDRKSPQSLNAIAKDCGIDKTQMSRSVKRLIGRGLVVHNRRGGKGQPRGLNVGPQWPKLSGRLRALVETRHRGLLAGLTRAETLTLEKTLDVLLLNAQKGLEGKGASNRSQV